MIILATTTWSNKVYSQSIAKVNGKPISSQRYMMHYQQLLLSHPNALGNVKLEKSLAQRALLPLVKEMLIREEADRVKLDLSQLRISDPMIALRRVYSTPKRIHEYLRRIGETEQTLKTKRWLQEATRMLMNKRGLLDVTEDEVHTEYQRQLPRLRQAERVRAWQILFKIPEHAQQIYQKLIQRDFTFEVAVWRYSEGPLKLKKGDLGFVKRGELVHSVEDKIWSLKEGEISKPIRSKYGWHILKRGVRVQPSHRTFDEVKESVKSGLIRHKFHSKSRSFIRALWKKATIQSSVSLRY